MYVLHNIIFGFQTGKLHHDIPHYLMRSSEEKFRRIQMILRSRQQAPIKCPRCHPPAVGRSRGAYGRPTKVPEYATRSKGCKGRCKKHWDDQSHISGDLKALGLLQNIEQSNSTLMGQEGRNGVRAAKKTFMNYFHCYTLCIS